MTSAKSVQAIGPHDFTPAWWAGSLTMRQRNLPRVRHGSAAVIPRTCSLTRICRGVANLGPDCAEALSPRSGETAGDLSHWRSCTLSQQIGAASSKRRRRDAAQHLAHSKAPTWSQSTGRRWRSSRRTRARPSPRRRARARRLSYVRKQYPGQLGHHRWREPLDPTSVPRSPWRPEDSAGGAQGNEHARDSGHPSRAV